MEVGAVKQAFNNEVILLKKKLDQAKIQIIHKLIRKAKQLKIKNERKATAAIDEVMIIKKIKPKDIAKFIATHKGELKDLLNKPTVDHQKACSRLLLHKALQEKYEFIRGRFSNVQIKDLFMSRIERRNMKKEAKEKQKNKKKQKRNKVTNSEGDWNVESIKDENKLNDRSKCDRVKDKELSEDNNQSESQSDEEMNTDTNEKQESETEDDTQKVENSLVKTPLGKTPKVNNSKELSDDNQSDSQSDEEMITDADEKQESETEDETEGNVKLCEVQAVKTKSNNLVKSPLKTLIDKAKSNKNPDRLLKDNKKRNFSEKVSKIKQSKQDSDSVLEVNKVVDSFFISANGKSYTSVVETRGPDEVKDVHKTGNRKLRRAIMFGHNPNLSRLNKIPNNFNDREYFSKSFNSEVKKSNDNVFKDREYSSKSLNAEVPLHPSWAAKKRLSNMPFEGKKTVFE